MRIPNEEWLHLAKGTGVGSSRRVRHGRERTEAMTVGNLPDRYWCYCQRCKTGAVEMKTHVLVGGPPPKESTSLVLPTDARGIHALLPHERDALTLQLARKSMDWTYFGTTQVTWSASRARLLIHTPSGVMGRDTSERSDQKWLTYERQHFIASGDAHPCVLLVEDTYSYYKVKHALRMSAYNVSVICTLGTAIHDSLMLLLLQTARSVWSFYDGDAAGYRGALQNARRLAELQGGGDVLTACAPPQKDPKDMNLGAIIEHVTSLLTTSQEKMP